MSLRAAWPPRSAVRQAERGSKYIGLPERQYLFDEEERRKTAMSFVDWQKLPSRRWVDVSDNDTEALGQIICWVSRPTRPELSLKHLHAYGNEGVRMKTGRPHPSFTDRPRKKRSEVEATFRTLDRMFRRGLRAGRALEHAWSNCLRPEDFGAALVLGSLEIFGIDRLAPASDERKKVWSEFISMVHVAKAVRSALIASGFDADADDLPDGTLTAELLAEPPPAGWIGRILIDAEEWSYRAYIQDLLPHPERLVRLNLRAKDLAA